MQALRIQRASFRLGRSADASGSGGGGGGGGGGASPAEIERVSTGSTRRMLQYGKESDRDAARAGEDSILKASQDRILQVAAHSEDYTYAMYKY